MIIPRLHNTILTRSLSCANSVSHASRSGNPSYFTPNRLLPPKLFTPNFFLSRRLFNSGITATEPLPTLSPPSVSKWLFGCSFLVFGVIVVGGVTRLTESGLSITEWKPFTGTIPPLSHKQWEEEFEKYKATPEFKLLNHQMTLPEFKRIFYMEWSHRILGRLIGLTYVIPFLYFLSSKRLTASLPTKLTGLACLLGFQGFLGWYMVKSGLEDSLMETPGAVPRVSQYRLAAHLGAALLLYAGMLGTGLSVLQDWKWAKATETAANVQTHGASLAKFLDTKVGRRFKFASWGILGLVFVTALSGAFVAGLDAGLLYNEFPLMGGRLAPPMDELFASAYAKNPDKSDLWWRNILENPTTVQFDHRCLAITTYFSTLALYVTIRRNAALRALLPPLTKRVVTGVFHAANLQVLLGISTLLYMVPIPLAAAHQAGSVVLLSCVVGLVSSLRRPGKVAQMWRRASRASKGSASASTTKQ
ncbi:Cytochrome c oxidase assembly protein cox15 [Tulasnella sp. 419]|nr:Cytochrome c oxidase assembly protein cox15 [Tulasnella sp. 419]